MVKGKRTTARSLRLPDLWKGQRAQPPCLPLSSVSEIFIDSSNHSSSSSNNSSSSLSTDRQLSSSIGLRMLPGAHTPISLSPVLPTSDTRSHHQCAQAPPDLTVMTFGQTSFNNIFTIPTETASCPVIGGDISVSLPSFLSVAILLTAQLLASAYATKP